MSAYRSHPQGCHSEDSGFPNVQGTVPGSGCQLVQVRASIGGGGLHVDRPQREDDRARLLREGCEVFLRHRRRSWFLSGHYLPLG